MSPPSWLLCNQTTDTVSCEWSGLNLRGRQEHCLCIPICHNSMLHKSTLLYWRVSALQILSTDGSEASLIVSFWAHLSISYVEGSSIHFVYSIIFSSIVFTLLKIEQTTSSIISAHACTMEVTDCNIITDCCEPQPFTYCIWCTLNAFVSTPL